MLQVLGLLAVAVGLSLAGHALACTGNVTIGEGPDQIVTSVQNRAVSGKCINDATKKQCDGQGPCTGSGTDWDGMHCQLASPGIPKCSASP